MTDYFESALATEKFLAQNRVDTDAGISWRRVPEGKPTHSFDHGSAGVLLFYIELFNATANEQYLQTARQAGDEILDYVNAKAREEVFISIALQSGWPGYVFVLNELFKVTDDARYRFGAITALDRITAQASAVSAGIGWIG